VSAADRIEIASADLTLQEVDAIVNPANERLAHGGGAAGAIARAAGPELQHACDELIATSGPLEPGAVVATEAFRLPCRKVIHAVGPVYGRHGGEEPRLLAAAHHGAVALAAGLGLRSIAFPAISCGIYGYPVEEAAPVALGATAATLAEHADAVVLVRFCFIAERERDAFDRALTRLRQELPSG
jgi:O-acetyl-ADP-ribose deacetylase (regulator of RNase III)